MKRIGKYEVLASLGRGGMAQVLLVRVPVIHRLAALKRLAPHPHLAELLGRERLHDLFRREAVTLGGLQHPNVMAVWDYAEDGPAPYYLMGYHSLNLGTVIGEGDRIEAPTRPIRIDRALDYTGQLLEGLACLHEAGIVHRDIKPHNLLLTDEDTLKICDFGLSRRHGQRFARPSQLKVGSPGYAAPEQEADPDAADARADLYAAGVVFYRLLTGRLPALDPRRRPPPPSRINPEFTADWDDFCKRALAREPEARYGSSAAMAADLARLSAQWQQSVDRTCRLPEADDGDGPAVRPAPPDAVSRRRPQKVREREARTVFGLDRLWRPRRYWPAERFERTGETVRDPWFRLIWQRSGSRYPLTCPRAREYIDGLNRRRHAGRGDWRLPTVAELATLLTPPPQATDFCAAAPFDPRQRRLWSADRKAHHAAWFASADLGFIAWQETLARCWVRAVCDG